MSIDIVIPEVGESVLEAVIADWKKKDGDFVEKNEVILVLDTNKASVEISAEASGELQTLFKEGEAVKVGMIVARINTDKKRQKVPVKEDDSTKEKIPSSKQENEAHPSPAAAKIMRENNLSSDEVASTGKDGRIRKEDVLNSLKIQRNLNDEKKVEQFPHHSEIREELGERSSKKEKMSSLRKVIASRLVQSKQETAMLTTFNELDMSTIIQLRKKYKEEFKEKYTVNLGFMSFFAKAVCLALKEYPILNAQIQGEEIISFNYVDLSIAVSTPKGLVVPVLRDAGKKSFAEIEKGILDLAIKGREFKLLPSDMEGGTFTITNGGIFGSMLSTPIINYPQSAILGMHNIVERAVIINGEVSVRPIMYLALSYDHRIIDGKEAVTFLVKVKTLLESPEKMLLDL